MSYTCEKGAKLYPYDIDKSIQYCEDRGIIKDAIVQPYYHSGSTISSRFFNEKWINICNEKDCDMNIIRNPRDARAQRCYPTRRLDENTGRLAKEIPKKEKEKLCNRIFYDEVPEQIFKNIQLAKSLIEKGAKRYYKSEIEDFTISREITTEMLYIWKCWIDLHGPDYGKMCIFPETKPYRIIYPNTIIRPRNYQLKYKKWLAQSRGNLGSPPIGSLKGAIEWLLKGGDEAYLWLKSEWVRNKILEKYPWVCFDNKNRL